MNEHVYGEMTWYWVSRRYLNERIAAFAFDKIHSYAKTREGELDAGVYRHGTDNSGLVYVTAVSHKPSGIAVIEQRLAGEDVDQHPATIDALITRRALVIGKFLDEGRKPGSHRIVHTGPQHLFGDGVMEDEL